MNRVQSNKMASFTATEAVLKAFPEIASVPGLPEHVEMLSSKMGEIQRLAVIQTQPLQLRTSERDLLLEAMTDTTLEIAGYVRNVARASELPLLSQSVQIGAGSFRRARRSHRVWFAQRVHDAAQTALPQLGAFGVTAETLATFQTRIQAATTRVNLPLEARATRKAATEELVLLFAQVDRLLNDGIDPLVFPLRKTNTEFYAAYRATRSVDDRPGSRAPKEASQVGPEAGATNPPSVTATERKAA